MMSRRWGLFAATTFTLIGLTLANLRAGPVAELGVMPRYAFWLATAAATFVSWWLSQWLVVSGRDRLSRGLLLTSSLVATLLFVPPSLALDFLFGLPETESNWLSLLLQEWLASALPVFSSCMIASLPAWLASAGRHGAARTPPLPPAAAPEPSPADATGAPQPADEPAASLLPLAVRGGVLRATADLQYVHLQSPEGVTTVPGPMHRVVGLLADHGARGPARGVDRRPARQAGQVRPWALGGAAEGRPAGRGEPSPAGGGQEALGRDPLQLTRALAATSSGPLRCRALAHPAGRWWKTGGADRGCP